MYRVACPACGAEVRFHATSSVLAVCSYCRSTLLRDADSVRDLGKMAELLDDYSPLQIASCGIWHGRQFTVVGRIQLQYDSGSWNEWHILFDDGESGWLADAVGQYVLTQSQGRYQNPPRFTDLRAGKTWPYNKRDYTFCDIREARCVAGEGELPFAVGPGYDIKVADARSGGSFLTLDYSEDVPQVYLGEAVTLKQLNMQRLRDERMIQTATGKLKGSVQQLECPSCGAGLDYRAGTATHLNCPSCGSEVDIQGERATVLGQHQALQTLGQRFTLANGSEAKIDGKTWTIIGLLGWVVTKDRSSSWNEYLLYEPLLGFRWLTETSDGWYLGTLMDVWVDQVTADYAIWGKKSFEPRYPIYDGEIACAAGAFPWRARVGERVSISEFASADGKTLLASEESKLELTWSSSSRISNADIARWFGNEAPLEPAFSGSPAKRLETQQRIATGASVLLWCINLPPLINSDSSAVFIILFMATCILWAPLNNR
ncbi:DUF4178 domain-containing protein [Vogesella sp. LIG4]|uniref:DUF4178 domain-containing protein n=1 Tax=Vogesella sp. LIG4 TaxID=1192162 RepID=UPI00081FF082|nr:DUF4178 domain-containing protein [Vogesella sp. LIG4]SCK12705.1 protein of unknown function [Vogesella sp. LIG4]